MNTSINRKLSEVTRDMLKHENNASWKTKTISYDKTNGMPSTFSFANLECSFRFI